MARPLAWTFVLVVVLIVMLPTAVSWLRRRRLARHGLTLPPQPDRDLRRPETHAWLLVSELLLKFPAEVAEGRRRRDLGERLAPEIERSRTLFLEHQGRRPEMEHLFQATLADILAGGDSGLLDG